MTFQQIIGFELKKIQRKQKDNKHKDATKHQHYTIFRKINQVFCSKNNENKKTQPVETALLLEFGRYNAKNVVVQNVENYIGKDKKKKP